jgi:hypothetical protein
MGLDGVSPFAGRCAFVMMMGVLKFCVLHGEPGQLGLLSLINIILRFFTLQHICYMFLKSRYIFF